VLWLFNGTRKELKVKSLQIDVKQTKELAKSLIDDVKNHVENHFERYVLLYREEMIQAKKQGRPIEPISITFQPCFPCELTTTTIDDNNNDTN
jgi:hypothetical protein